MEKLYVAPTEMSPEIIFNPGEDTFLIKGSSRPEDVRELYAPVIDWIKDYYLEIINRQAEIYNEAKPLTFQFDLEYFNSSSAKFFYDIIMAIREFKQAGVKVKIIWYYEEDDTDMKEAGEDLSILAEIKFKYIPKPDTDERTA